jgi:hypothetical protein
MQSSEAPGAEVPLLQQSCAKDRVGNPRFIRVGLSTTLMRGSGLSRSVVARQGPSRMAMGRCAVPSKISSQFRTLFQYPALFQDAWVISF